VISVAKFFAVIVSVERKSTRGFFAETFSRCFIPKVDHQPNNAASGKAGKNLIMIPIQKNRG
jgi:hypothetical protein